MLFDQFRGDIHEAGLQVVRVGDDAAKEVARTARDRREALGDETSSAGFRGRDGYAAHVEVIADDLFERFSGAGKQMRLERVFEFVGEPIDFSFGEFECLGAAAKVYLDLA